MNSPEAPSRSLPLPRYGIREDEMTRPCIVLYDWNGDDEVTVRVNTAAAPAAGELDDDLDVNPFRPRWHGIGRRPGTVALAFVLGVSAAIGLAALLAPGNAHAETQGTSLSVR